MHVRARIAVLAVTLAATLAPSALAQSQRTVTAVGSTQVSVTPADPKENASIVAAVDAAEQAAIAPALADARARAERLAAAAGLTLGDIVSVGDVVSQPYGPFGGTNSFGPFGVDRYCGVITRAVTRRVPGTNRRRVVGRRRVRVCHYPRRLTNVLEVTFAAQPAA